MADFLSSDWFLSTLTVAATLDVVITVGAIAFAAYRLSR